MHISITILTAREGNFKHTTKVGSTQFGIVKEYQKGIHIPLFLLDDDDDDDSEYIHATPPFLNNVACSSPALSFSPRRRTIVFVQITEIEGGGSNEDGGGAQRQYGFCHASSPASLSQEGEGERGASLCF